MALFHLFFTFSYLFWYCVCVLDFVCQTNKKPQKHANHCLLPSGFHKMHFMFDHIWLRLSRANVIFYNMIQRVRMDVGGGVGEGERKWEMWKKRVPSNELEQFDAVQTSSIPYSITSFAFIPKHRPSTGIIISDLLLMLLLLLAR